MSSFSSSSSEVKHHDPQISRRWMTFLAQHEKSKHIFPHASLIQIPQLGVHDAGTFGIHSTSELAADLPEVLKKLPKFLNMTARRHIATWSKTQHLNLFQQLDRYGCRYFDLRICPHFPGAAAAGSTTKTDAAPVSVGAPFTLWLTHGSFSLPLEAGLDQIVAFLESKKRCDDHHPHPHHHHKKHGDNDDDNEEESTHHEGENLEVFVLDVQRISGFTESRHYVKLAEILWSKLGKYLVPRQYDLTTPLKTIWENGWRVFLLAQKDGIEYMNKALELVACGGADTSPMASPKAPLPPTEAEAAAASDITPPPPPPTTTTTTTRSETNNEEENENNEKEKTRGQVEFPKSDEQQKEKDASKNHNLAELLHLQLIPRLHPRNPLTIRSHWYNQRYKNELIPRLTSELLQRSKTYCGERCQLHVLQAILTPTAADMAVAFGTGGSGKESLLSDNGDLNDSHFSEAEQKEYKKRHSILDFAKQINSDLITLWEDESRWAIDGAVSDDFFVFRTIEDLKRARPVAFDNSDKEKFATKQIPATPFGFDPRNVFMIDFVEIGRSRKTGKNAFEVCFDLACRRFGVVETK